jgi:hypothetical protein
MLPGSQGRRKRLRRSLPRTILVYLDTVTQQAVAASHETTAADPFRAVAELRQASNALTRAGCLPGLKGSEAAKKASFGYLTHERGEAVRLALDAARCDARKLIRAERYQAALAVAEAARTRLSEDARETGISDEVDKFRQSCKFLARLAPEAGQPYLP